jgi:hypothetical protein
MLPAYFASIAAFYRRFLPVNFVLLNSPISLTRFHVLLANVTGLFYIDCDVLPTIFTGQLCLAQFAHQPYPNSIT